MKRALFALVAALLLSAGSGCLHHQIRCGNGQAGGCGCGHCGGLLGGAGGCHAIAQTRGWRQQAPDVGPAGPPTAAVAYPYYTLRGPRDFFIDNPPSIWN